MRKWRENEEMEREKNGKRMKKWREEWKWREGEKMERE